MSDKHFVGLDLTGFEDNGESRPVSRITLMVDDENMITAGDDTGLELTANCPHATQEMADAILEKLRGYKYRMYTADDANIDPAAELGDGVTAGGVYSVIAHIADSGDGYMSVSAPGEEELEDEYPSDGPVTQQIQRNAASANRKIAETRSYIEKTAESITQGVESLSGNLQSLSEQTVEGFAQTVRKDGIISAINQSAEEIKIDASKVTITGESIRLEGYTTINGAFSVDLEGSMHAAAGSSIGDLVVGNDDVNGSFLAFYATEGTPGIENSEFCIAPKLGQVVLSRENNCLISREEIRLGDMFSVDEYPLQAPIQGLTDKPSVPTLHMRGNELLLQSYFVKRSGKDYKGTYLTSPNDGIGITAGTIFGIQSGTNGDDSSNLSLTVMGPGLYGGTAIASSILLTRMDISFTADRIDFYGPVHFHNGYSNES